MATVQLTRLCKNYPNGFQAVRDLDLSIDDGEFLVMVGPSGCGKSTTLRMIAGLEDITAGDLHIGDRRSNEFAPKDRDIAMVFQNYALYPHMSVGDNIGFALRLAKTPKAEKTERVRDVARVLEFDELLDRKPGQLSGGQRQRVAMGRALIRRPQVFLLDEPLSNLDAKLRGQTRGEISRIQREVGVTTFYVTHDQVEAMTMADRVAVMKEGILQQVDNPQKLYDEPTNVFVAGFIGSPAMNLFRAPLEERDGSHVLTIGTQAIDAAALMAYRPQLKSRVGTNLVVGLRPEDLGDTATAQTVEISAVVADTEALGHEQLVYLDFDAEPIIIADIGPDEGTPQPFASRIDPRTTAQIGARVTVHVNLTRAHLFDAETHRAIR